MTEKTFADLTNDALTPEKVEEPEATTWEPLDLGPYLRNEIERPTPSVGLRRTDGLRFIYPGKEHSVIGEMESGKSWFSLGCCLAEMAEGNHVVYVHFEEADPSDSIERLLALGATVAQLEKLFHFVTPERPATAQRLEQLTELSPTLVILDGVNEGMSLHQMAIREEDGAARWREVVVRPFIKAGAAVLSADHVVKDPERRGRGPLGSIHKGNGLSGSLILLEPADPFGRGQKGRSFVFVTKDRPGHLRRNGRATKTPNKTFMGSLIVDDTRLMVNYLDLALVAPGPEKEDDDVDLLAVSGDDQKVLDGIAAIIAQGGEANVRAIRATVSLRNPTIDSAIERLKLAGKLIEASGPRNSRIFTVIDVEESN